MLIRASARLSMCICACGVAGCGVRKFYFIHRAPRTPPGLLDKACGCAAFVKIIACPLQNPKYVDIGVFLYVRAFVCSCARMLVCVLVCLECPLVYLCVCMLESFPGRFFVRVSFFV